MSQAIPSNHRSSLKSRAKAAMQAIPWLWHMYWGAKQQLLRIGKMRFFLYDMKQTYRAMFWAAAQKAHRPLSAELLFQYHKLEKGMVMPGPPRLFGLEPARATITLLHRWRKAGLPESSPVFVGAVETLRAYCTRIEVNGLDPNDLILPPLRQFLAGHPSPQHEMATPMPLPANEAMPADPVTSFRQLTWSRRSVRDFRHDPVPLHLVRECIESAQLSPSACNRQPCRVRLLDRGDRMTAVLNLQNGNRGFGHLMPHLAVLTADESCFFDASERHEPYIDGGLFAMSFILALRSHGVGSCCLNWCVPPANDLHAHRLLDIPQSERIIMLIAIGWAAEECQVPRSPRRDLEEVLIHL